MLSGSVPFPESSKSEKRKDHQKTEPKPIVCPGVPAGLAQAAYKMMAKKPGDRFQSARECAEALTPYVDVSSASLPNLKATVDWDGSVMTIIPVDRRRKRFVKWVTIAALLVLVSAGLGFGVAQFFNGDDGKDTNPSNGDRRIAKKTAPENSTPGKTNGGKQKPASNPQQSKPDSWVLTVAKDGSGQFKSINAALEKVKPGMTIRVLDDAVYPERIFLNSPSRQSGITLESPKRATLVTESADTLIKIEGVPDITIRGFRLSAAHQDGNVTLVNVRMPTSGLMLDELDFTSSIGHLYNGVEVHGVVVESA
ncbi:MAG: hypothetical protein IID45_06945, partial [Planctomycetes bacterium]|nr:hypothetical protein [Planctomycetota bacterium]